MVRLGHRHPLRLLIITFTVLMFAGTLPASAGGEEKATEMKAEQSCADGAVARSICVLKAILDDVAATYPEAGGGGITSIRLDTSSLYEVAIAQEERIDLIRYEFEVSDTGEVHILSREIGVKTPG